MHLRVCVRVRERTRVVMRMWSSKDTLEEWFSPSVM